VRVHHAVRERARGRDADDARIGREDRQRLLGERGERRRNARYGPTCCFGCASATRCST
jgi:hypothetical protein